MLEVYLYILIKFHGEVIWHCVNFIVLYVCKIVYRDSFLAVKRPGRDVDHPLLSSAEVRHEESSTSTPPAVPVLALYG